MAVVVHGRRAIEALGPDTRREKDLMNETGGYKLSVQPINGGRKKKKKKLNLFS